MKQRDVHWLNKKVAQGIKRDVLVKYLSANYSDEEIEKFLPKTKRTKKADTG